MTAKYLTGLFKRALSACVVVVAVCAFAVPAQAQYRAQLSAGLLQTLQTSASTTQISVLVQASQAELDRLAKAYNLTVTKRISRGGVLTGSAANIAKLANDPNVSSLREDGTVLGMMNVTTQSTGAN